MIPKEERKGEKEGPTCAVVGLEEENGRGGDHCSLHTVVVGEENVVCRLFAGCRFCLVVVPLA